MIDYSTLKVGDKLRIIGKGAPGFAKLGDIVEVISTDGVRRCDVKREDGETAYFALTCGADRLEPADTATMDYWERIKADDSLANARRKLSMCELRTLFQHARDSIQSPPFPDEPSVKLTTDIIPYSSIVGGGLMLKGMKGNAAFIVSFIGTTQGITKEETQALLQQFSWFVHTFGCRVPARDPS